jgi:hypothetical protein
MLRQVIKFVITFRDQRYRGRLLLLGDFLVFEGKLKRFEFEHLESVVEWRLMKTGGDLSCLWEVGWMTVERGRRV